MRFLLISLISFYCYSQTTVNCLSSGLDGPQDGAELNTCSKVLVPGTEKSINCFTAKLNKHTSFLCKNLLADRVAINCLSVGADGPQDGSEIIACENMVIPGSGQFLNCLSSKLDGPQTDSDRKICKSVSI